MSQHLRQARALTFTAGPSAIREIRADGLRLGRIGTLAGASGGAKWLALSQLDRVIARRILPGLQGSVHMIGTSIGAWRMACFGQADPLAAIDRFESAYLGQTYSERPDREEISRRTADILDTLLGEHGAGEILAHPVLRMHVMTVRSRGLAASERPAALMAALATAAGLNAMSRRSLGLMFDRVLFFDPRCADTERPPFFDVPGFPLHQVPLGVHNLRHAIIATGSIPLVMAGVRDIPGAPEGMYRDGGVIDYHIDLPHSSDGRLSLFAHFYNYLRPGWFDKRLSWRRPKPAHVDRTILVSPSPEFVASLPHGKIPDRHDFVNLTTEERVASWRKVVDACRRLADELEDVLDRDRLDERLSPF